MSTFRFILINLYVCLLCIGLVTSPVQAADKVLGCCIKTEKADPHTATYTNIPKEECVATDNDPWTVEFKSNSQVSGDKKKCEEKPKVNERKLGDPIFFTPSVSIPDTKYIAGQDVKIEDSTSALANYIVAIFKYSTGVIGIIAAIVLMIAGIMWLTAAGNQEQIGNAKTMIASSLMGLILTLGSFVILSMVNTNLVKLKITPVTKIENIRFNSGCCEKKSQNGAITATQISQDECEKIQKNDVNENGYSSVTFFPEKDRKAIANKCEPIGCCEVSSPSKTFYENSTREECKQKNLQQNLTNFNFYEDKKASDDSKGCLNNTSNPSGSLCIGIGNFGCNQKSDCCSGFCILGYPEGNRCESCIPQGKPRCASDSDCCPTLHCVIASHICM